jgi:uncharacterized membrane protein YccF (DUF307 family)
MTFWRLLGNIIWLLTAGLTLAISLGISGILMCITIIGIPFGIQSFKMMAYVLWPFGTEIVQATATAPGCIGNVIWFIFGGIPACLLAFFWGIVMCITIIGIPFGLAAFRMIPLLAFPFGKTLVPRPA